MNAIAAPRVLREKWGMDVVEQAETWIKEILRSEGIHRDEFREVVSRLDRLEQGQEELKEEVYRLRGEMNGFRSEVNERFDRMSERFDRMSERFDRMNERMLSMIKWTVGTIALFGTIISVLMAVFKFAG